MANPDETQQVEEVIERLAERYPSASHDETAELVRNVHRRLSGARIRDFGPILVEHEARDALVERLQRAELRHHIDSLDQRPS